MADTQHWRCSTAPAVTGLVRPRLIHALEGSAGATLGLVIAPAGMGKTTLLAHWAAQEEGTAFWYRATPTDAVPGRMLATFRTALAIAVGDDPAQSLPELAVMAEKLSCPFTFVVDDLHMMAGSCAEAEFEQLLSLGSPLIRFFVGSRRPPSFNLARSEVPSFVTVGPDELRFRTPEVEQLFRTTYKQPLGAAGAFNLTRRTDGWAAALHLFHTATKNRSSVERRRAAESLAPAPRYAQDYVANHVLAGTSPDMEELLLRTCLLDRLTPARCDVLLETSGTGRILNELADLGILMRDDGATAFRLPEVVRQHLVARLADSPRSPLEGVRQRTAAVLEQEGDYRAGMAILAEGRNWDNVRQMMVRARHHAFLPGACRWAATVPEPLTGQDVLFALALARCQLDDGCAAGAYRTAAEVPKLSGDEEHLRIAQDLRETAVVWAGDHPATGPGAVGILRAASHGNPASAARSVHHPRKPEDLLAKAIALLLAGDQRGALPFLTRCAESSDDQVPALAAQLALAVLGPDSTATEASGPADEVDAVERQADRLGFSWLARLARGIQSALFGAAGRQAAVLAVVEDCELRGDEWGAALVAAADILSQLQAGRPDYLALEALADRFRKLDAGALEAWVQSAKALVCATQDLPNAGEEAQTAEAFARTAEVPGALAVAYAAMAEASPERHTDLMQAAAETAKSAGFVCRPWTWLKPEAKTEKARTQDASVTLPASASNGLTSPVSQTPPLPTLDIRCFGGFSICVGGAGVDLTRVRPQARTVLRMLALNAGRPVHRERLAGALWADLDTPSALHNLQVSLSSLRRVLLPDGSPAESRQSIMRQGEAYALLFNDGSNLDLSHFDRALHDGSAARTAGNHEEAAAKLRQAVELYVGEVLPEDGTAEWVTDARERYRLRAAEAAAALATLELSLGNRAAAAAAASRSVEIDPWRDESWRTLIGICRSSGDPAAAEHAERRYRGMLRSLGVPLNQGFSPET